MKKATSGNGDAGNLPARFRFEAKLGQGGMGEVYQAHDTVLRRTVAVKTVTPGRSDPDAVRRLLREARASARLTHAGIVTIHDVLEADGNVWIVMEHLEGESLAALDRTGRPWTLEAKIGIVVEVLDALAYAHGQGVVHRDIKPSNVQRMPDGSVKVIDFGIAVVADAETATETGTVRGTAHYASPEQLRGETSDAGADIYSTGILAYEILTRRRPFAGTTMAAVVTQVLQDPLPPMDGWWSDAFPEIERIVRRATAKERRERYAHAEDMRNALTAFLASSREAIAVRQAEVAATTQRTILEARGLMGAGRPAEAATLLRKALRSDPDADEVRALLEAANEAAGADTRQGDTREAEAPPTGDAHAPRAGLTATESPSTRSGAPGTEAQTGAATRPGTEAGPEQGSTHGWLPHWARAASAAPAAGAIVLAAAIWLEPFKAPQTPEPGEPPAGTQPFGRTAEEPGNSEAAPDPPPVREPGGERGPNGEEAPTNRQQENLPATRVATSERTATQPAEPGTEAEESGETRSAGNAGPAGEETPPGAADAASGAKALYYGSGPAEEADDEGSRLAGMQYRILQQGPGGIPVEVDADTVFRSGDRIRFVFEPNVAGFLYVIQRGSSGRWSVLLPHPEIDGGQNRVAPYESVSIPPAGWFRFDDNPGTEQVFVYLSREPARTLLPWSGRPIAAAQTVGEPTVIALQNSVRSRDLVFETADTPDAADQAAYIVNQAEAANAVAWTVELRHQ